MAVTASEPPSILPSPGEGETTIVVRKLAASVLRTVEPVGRWYEAYQNRLHSKHSISQHSLQSSSSDESEDDTETVDNTEFLMSLDPKDWKNQDHYVVLGLEDLRYKATEDQIKKAYKRQVLHHHPDKRKARGLNVKEGDDDYFTCITRAWETLGVPVKRKSFDSIDPEFDEDVPPNNAHSKDHFYEVFHPVFERNSRWSKKLKVPDLGNKKTPYDDVDDFYAFWYDFDSWREFSYLDEEDKEKGENRDERRWFEKQNKAARQKRKKEETMRMRQLVDNAYACDPRIIKFKEDEKAKKAAIKKAKQDAIKQKQDAEEKERRQVEEEERMGKQKVREEIKAKAEAVKKEKEEQDRVSKNERKLLMASAKEKNYFANNDDERVKNILEVDKLARLISLVSLKELNEKIKNGDQDSAKAAYQTEVKKMNAQLEEEKRKQVQELHKKKGSDGKGNLKDWSDQEIQFLIKAVNLFPAGTQDRWEVIAKFIKQHINTSNKNAKDSLAKAKELQKNDGYMKESADKKAFEKFNEAHKAAPVSQQGVPSERLETVAEQQIKQTGSNPAPWSADEQKLLEQALKTYNASTPERWEKISEAVPSRSKKDCMKRYKELCEAIKAKKAVLETAAKGKKT